MKKIGAALLFILSGSTFGSENQRAHLKSAANYWTQAPVRVSNEVFDMAIQGNGFFVLQGKNDFNVYSRDGSMKLNAAGLLIQKESGFPVLGYCDGSLGRIDLRQYLYDNAGSAALWFATRLDGTIVGTYEDGSTRETCQLALASFANPSKLRRIAKHILEPTKGTGLPRYGIPQQTDFGSVFDRAVEELCEDIYLINLSKVNVRSTPGPRE